MTRLCFFSLWKMLTETKQGSKHDLLKINRFRYFNFMKIIKIPGTT